MLKLIKRSQASPWMSALAPLISIALTLIIGFFLFAALGQDPWHAFQVFFINPLSSLYNLTELLLKATPLIIIAVGLAIGFRANVWNIGAEGQYIMGAIAATGVALHVHPEMSQIWALFLMTMAGIFGGMFWSGLTAWLRTRFNANEILVSLMLVYVAQLLASYMVHTPWKDPEGYGFPQTRLFEANALLPIVVEGSRLTVASFLIVLVPIIAYVFIFKSYPGYKMLVSGHAQSAARYAGFSINGGIWIGLLCGGAAAGLAGMAEVAGPAGQLTSHIAQGYGFAAIIVAYVGRLHPLGIIFSGLLMALLYLGGEQAQQYLGLPASIGRVFQGLLLFFLLGCDVLIHYRIGFSSVRLFKTKEAV